MVLIWSALCLLLAAHCATAFLPPPPPPPSFLLRSEASTPSDCEPASPSLASPSPASPSPASPSPASLKLSILSLCATCDRGFGASPADRSKIEALLEELSPLSPTEEPTQGIAEEDERPAPLRGCWRLVYTSASDVSTLGANPLVSVGGIYQDARQLPVITNVIDVQPRALQSLPPGPVASALASSLRLNVSTRARPRGGARAGLTFEAVAAEPRTLFGKPAPDWLPSPPRIKFPEVSMDLQRKIFGVAEGDDPRDSDKNPAFFDVMFLDTDFLAIKQGKGGGIFAAVKVDELAE
ncbi:hypothetical protein TeGR_g1370 [Tetraparma gracilis]|uniref:Plastid lipid-associated protein/fibrillin conserved domain-containing protein n=1 Tax=Tetraparma gracilis TaxID=2962635 RepID=A0ABQ6NA18_9STRA|nr:hypothetical protein TeGR_g1370 [Tetraparma gracilis]